MRRPPSPAPTEPLYRIGETVAFNVGGTSELYLRTGWIRPEPRYRWSNGHESILVLMIDRASLGDGAGFLLHLTIEPLVVVGRHDRQRLSVAVNGQAIYDDVLASRTSLAIPLPRALLESVLTVVRFGHPDFRRPIDLVPGSRDEKPLAFRFFEFAIRAA